MTAVTKNCHLNSNTTKIQFFFGYLNGFVRNLILHAWKWKFINIFFSQRWFFPLEWELICFRIDQFILMHFDDTFYRYHQVMVQWHRVCHTVWSTWLDANKKAFHIDSIDSVVFLMIDLLLDGTSHSLRQTYFECFVQRCIHREFKRLMFSRNFVRTKNGSNGYIGIYYIDNIHRIEPHLNDKGFKSVNAWNIRDSLDFPQLLVT